MPLRPGNQTRGITRRHLLEVACGGIAALAIPACGGGSTPAPRLNSLTSAQSAQIDALANAQAGKTTPGLQLGISYNGSIIAARGYGRRSLAPSEPMLSTTPMFIGSVTKQITAACILLLQEDGTLSINDPLSKYVPEITYGSQITLRQMLNQISGLVPDPTLLFNPPAAFTPTSTATYLSRLNEQALDFPSGTEYQYSNPNFWLLGLIIERLAKVDYNTFLQTRIFAKAGMASSYLYTTRSDSGTALGYEATADGSSFILEKMWDLSYLFSTGGIISTVSDVLAWDAALSSGRILNSASLATMFAAVTLPSGASTHYGMGWVIGDNVIWHNGQLSGFHAMNGMFSDGYAVVVLGNESQLNGTPDLWVPEDFAVAIHAVLNPNLVVNRIPLVPAPSNLE